MADRAEFIENAGKDIPNEVLGRVVLSLDCRHHPRRRVSKDGNASRERPLKWTKLFEQTQGRILFLPLRPFFIP
jgi:hypothetical protein